MNTIVNLLKGPLINTGFHHVIRSASHHSGSGDSGILIITSNQVIFIIASFIVCAVTSWLSMPIKRYPNDYLGYSIREKMFLTLLFSLSTAFVAFSIVGLSQSIRIVG